jgi:hypothetical protein
VQPEVRSWHVSPNNTVMYISAPSSQDLISRTRSVLLRMGSFLAYLLLGKELCQNQPDNTTLIRHRIYVWLYLGIKQKSRSRVSGFHPLNGPMSI